MSPLIRGSLLIVVATVLVVLFSDWPAYRFNDEGDAALVVSINRITEKESHCTAEEKRAFLESMKGNRPHMNRPGRECGSRERLAMILTLQIDGGAVQSIVINPSGIHNDGATYFHKRFIIAAGKHTIVTSLSDDKETGGFVTTFEQTLSFGSRQVRTLQLNPGEKQFMLH